jgi:D-alanyl-D-alanine carboxypeptidase/D-alanyl-D-alanine-endopeptidase (penicillin-binding protein 4)
MHASRVAAVALLSAAVAGGQAPAASVPVVHRAYPTGLGTALGKQIQTLLADPAVARAHWGIAVTTQDGTPLYGLGEGKLFRPASNNKIFTTAAAMALLGPEKTFETCVVGDFDPATGTVSGDLTLVGGGDASFGTNDLPYVPPLQRTKNAVKPPALADLEAMVDQLVAKGVKRVTGDIVGDDTLFPYEPYAESWAADDQVWDYGAPVSALSIADNQMKLTVTPGIITGTKGRETYQNGTAVLEQHGVAYYSVVSQVDVIPAGSKDSGVQVERLPGSHTLRVYGQLAADAQPDIEEVAIADPAEYAAMALKAMLEQRGIVVGGGIRAEHRELRDASGFLSEVRSPNRCEAITVAGGECAGDCEVPNLNGTVLASHVSAPLVEDVVLTNKVSQNLHAELLFHDLGRRATCHDGSIAASASMVRAFLIHAGVDGNDFTFFDGSGLSAHDLVTPRAAATFLAYAAKQPWFAAWKASLPEGGVDGSLETRFPELPLKGHLFAKTGTLGESRALSGYLDAASGRTILFSVMVDDHAPGGSADRVVMDKIVAAIAAAN